MKKFNSQCISEIKIQKMRPWYYFLNFLLFFNLDLSAADTLPLQGQLYFKSNNLNEQLSSYINQQMPVSGTYVLGEVNVDQWPINVGQINYVLTSDQITFNSMSQSVIKANFGKANILLVVPEMKIQTHIQQTIGGVTLNLNVNTTCQNIAVTISSDKLSVPVYIYDENINQVLSLKAAIKSLDTENIKLNLNQFSCTNIKGIESFISDQIQLEFSKLDWFKTILINRLNVKINELFTSYNNKINSVILQQVQKLSVSQNIKTKLLKFDEKYFYIKFALDADLSSEEVVDLPTAFSTNDQPIVLSFNVDEFKKKSFSYINEKLSTKSFSSKSIDSINALTKSRWKQFFAWPALMSRPKGTELIFKPYLESINYSIAANTFTQNLNITSTAGLWTYESNMAMVYFRSKIKASVKAENNSKDFITQLNSISTSYVWNKDYVNKYDVSERISTSIIDSSLKTTYNSDWVKQSFNFMKVNENNEYNIKDLYLDSNTNKIYFRLSEYID